MQELRKKLLEKTLKRADRSFIIPVLDYSAASKYNILTLLSDLSDIDGDVIVIFNNKDVAKEISNHPRINFYSIMSKNTGVSRAWNVGLEVSQTSVSFICNSDLHIKKNSVEVIEEALDIDDCAMAGPQGSNFSFAECRDLVYFPKGSFDKPLVVDAVSGFYFAVKTRPFTDGTVKFENLFTPCYFEEWDIGIQIKKAGLKSYIAPTSDYDHIWSGSINSYEYIEYFNKKEKPMDILSRNKKLFIKKWEIYKNENFLMSEDQNNDYEKLLIKYDDRVQKFQKANYEYDANLNKLSDIVKELS